MTAPDLSIYRTVHLALRGGADLLADVAATIQPGNHPRVAALRRYWDGYTAEVHAHHTVEDDVFFPALVARVPFAAEVIRQTDADHQALAAIGQRCDRAVSALVQGQRTEDLATCFAELAELMRRHLDLEDDDVLPLFERHFTAAEYAPLDDEAKKRIRISEALFTVPFVAHFASDEVRAHLLGGAPVPFRVIHRLMRGRHARLVEVLAAPAGTRADRAAGAVA